MSTLGPSDPWGITTPEAFYGISTMNLSTFDNQKRKIVIFRAVRLQWRMASIDCPPPPAPARRVAVVGPLWGRIALAHTPHLRVEGPEETDESGDTTVEETEEERLEWLVTRREVEDSTVELVYR